MKKALLSLTLVVAMIMVTGTQPGYTAPGGTGLEAYKDVDKGLLEVYFKRAQGATDEAQWRRIVESGISVVVGRWESAAVLAGDTGDPAILRGLLGEEAEARFSEWLVTDFFRKLSGAQIEDVIDAVEKANSQYLYDRDESGNIQTDEAGDPILKKGFTVENDKTDLDRWNGEVGQKIDEVLASWENNAKALAPELLASGEAQSDFQFKLVSYKQGLRNEFNRIQAQEARLFRAKRETDQYSLRKKTDAEAAGETVTRLIADAQTEGDAGLQKVRDGLETLSTEVSVKGVDIRSQDWLESFQREFDKGLSCWESAERDFLRKRGEWEKEVGIRFEAGQKEWADAFGKLRDARKQWEAGFIAEKEKGLRLWQDKSAYLRTSIQEAEEKLEKAIGQRSAGVNMQISALMDMYLQANTTATTAKNSIDFWTKDIKDLLDRYNLNNGSQADMSVSGFNGLITDYRNNLKNNTPDSGGLDALILNLQSIFNQKNTEIQGVLSNFNYIYAALNTLLANNTSDAPLVFDVGIVKYEIPSSSYDKNGNPTSELAVYPPYCEDFIKKHFRDYFTVNGITLANLYAQMNTLDDPSHVLKETDTATFTHAINMRDEDTGKIFYNGSSSANYFTATWQADTSSYLQSQADDYTKNAADAQTYIKELKFWLEQENTYNNYMGEASDSLQKTYGLAIGDPQNQPERNADTGDWTTILLDDYQRELLIAKGEQNYWDKQVKIAEAVHDYAIDTSSGRKTEAQTEADYNDALDKFNIAQGKYNEAVASLEGLARNVNAAKADYTAAKEVWDEARTKLEQAENEYQEKIGIMMSMGDEYYRDRVQSQYDELLVRYGLKDQDGTKSHTQVLADYYAAMKQYGSESQVSANVEELNYLLNGSSEREMESLADLKNHSEDYNNLIIYSGDKTTITINGKIKEQHPQYSGLDRLIKLYNAASGNDKQMLDNEIEALCAKIQKDAEEEYQRRMETISFLSVENYGDWTVAQENGNNSTDDIVTEAQGAETVYLKQKADTILKALGKIDTSKGAPSAQEQLEFLLQPAEPTDSIAWRKIAIAYLKQFGTDGINSIEKLTASLTTIRDMLAGILGGSGKKDLASNSVAIKGLTADDRIALDFFRNNGNIFGSDQTDYTDLFQPELAAGKLKKEERARIVTMYGSMALCLANEKNTAAMTGLHQFIVNSGIGLEASGALQLKDPETVFTAVLQGRPVTREIVLAAVKTYRDSLAALPEDVPEWIRDRLSQYVDKLADYFTLKLVMANANPLQTGWDDLKTWHNNELNLLNGEQTTLKNEQDQLAARTSELRTLEGVLANPDKAGLPALAAIYGELKAGTAWLYESGDSDKKAMLSLTVTEAEAKLVELSAVTLADAQYRDAGKDAETLLGEIAQSNNASAFLINDAVLKGKILARAAEILDKAKQIDNALLRRDFTGVDGPEARYALWQTIYPESVYDEIKNLNYTDILQIMSIYGENSGKTLSAEEKKDLQSEISESGLSLSAIAGIKGEGKAFSRALYLGLCDAGNTNPALWQFLCDVYGLEQDDNITSVYNSWISGKDQADPNEKMLFAYGGSEYGETYFLKKLILSGGDYKAYATQLTVPQRSEIDLFNGNYLLMKNYIPSVDGDKFTYVGNNVSGALNVSERGAILDNGIGVSDPFFMQTGDGAGYLEFLAVAQGARSNNLGELFLARCNEEEKALTDSAQERNAIQAQVERELKLVERWKNSMDVHVKRGELEYDAKYGFNCRMALEQENLITENESEQALTSTEITDVNSGPLADTRPPGSTGYTFYYYDSLTDQSGYKNEELDQFNALLLEARSLCEGVNLAGNAPDPTEGSLKAYFDAMQDFNADDYSGWAAALTGNTSLQPDSEAMKRAANALAGDDYRIGMLKDGLGSAAEALELVNITQTEYKEKVINPLRGKLDDLKKAYSVQNAVMHDKEGIFFDANAKYQEKENELKGLYDNIEERRFKLQKKEEVLLYAKSMYLQADGGATTLTVDPAQKLAQAQFEYAKANQVYTTLQRMFNTDETRQPVQVLGQDGTNLFQAYGNSYRSYLRMKEAQKMIEDAIQIQEGNVNKAWNEALEKLQDLGGLGKGNTTKFAPTDGTYKIPENSYLTAEYWMRYFNLPEKNSRGEYDQPWAAALSLNSSNFAATGTLTGEQNSTFPDLFNTTNGLTNLTNFQQKITDYTSSEQFTKDFGDWAYNLSNKAVNNPIEYNALMDQWEDAYYYLMAAAVNGGADVTKIESYTSQSGYDQDGHPLSVTVQKKVLKKQVKNSIKLIRTMGEPFLEKREYTKYWWDLGGTHKKRHIQDGTCSIDERIINGQQAFKLLTNPGGSDEYNDFSFFVFLTKAGIISDNKWQLGGSTEIKDTHFEDGLFASRVYYRLYYRLDGSKLTNIEATTEKYRLEQDKLTLLEKGTKDGTITANSVLNAVVEAAKILKPEGFHYGDGDTAVTNELTNYFSGAINQFFTAAHSNQYQNEAGNHVAASNQLCFNDKKMSDVVGFLSSEAGKQRDVDGSTLAAAIDGLKIDQDKNLSAYQQALEALKNADQSNLAARTDAFQEAAEQALKNCQYQNKDIQLAYYNLYKSLIKEYVDGFEKDQDNPFGLSGTPQRGITSKSAIFGEIQELMQMQAQKLTELYTERLGGYKLVQTEEMKQKYRELQARQGDWEDKMDAILERGKDEWASADKKFTDSWQAWGNTFAKEYEAKNEQWNANYLNFNDNRNAWVADAEKKLADVGKQGVAESLGTNADERIAISLGTLISDMSALAVKPNDVVTQILGSDLFSKITAYARVLNNGIQYIGTGVYAGLAGGNIMDTQVLSRVEDFLSDRHEEISKHTAAITVRTAEQTIGESIQDMIKQVVSANKNVDENITSILDRAGFRRAGSSFSRNVISGSSIIGGNEYDTQKINAYAYFVAPQFKTTVNLRDDVVAEMSQEGINALVAKAIRELQQQVKEVFSGVEKPANGDTTPAAKSQFQRWVGDQAQLVKNPDPKHVKFKDPGSGEMGRIFQKFLEDEVIRSAGEAEAKAPFYNKPLWGTILGIEGPSIRGIIDVALSVVSNVIKVVPAIGWLVSGVINSIDDFVFTGLDIANGMDADEAWLSFGKKAACNLITGGLGALGNAAGTALKLGTDVAGVIGKTAIAGVQAFASNAATGAINAIDFNSSGQLSFNSKSWQNSMWGKDALVGYAGTMGMTFAMEGLNSAILGEGTITGYDAQTDQNLWSYSNFEAMDVTNIKSITRLAGGALKAGMEYGFTGQTTLNVLQIGGTGVMEMRLGGNRPMFGIGMNGIDASIGTFASAIQGFRDIGKNNQIVEATKNNLILGNASEREKAAKLRMQYSFGDAKDRLQLDNILAGRDTLTIGSDVPENAQGKTILGDNGGRMIYANSSNSSDFKTWLAEGTTLQHEAYRDGKIGTKAEQDAETVRAVTAHTEMALRMANAFGGNFIIGDANLSNDVGKYLMAQRGIGKFSDYVNETYDSTADYWKLTKEGKLLFDNKADLYDENGNLIQRFNPYQKDLTAEGNYLESSLYKWLDFDPRDSRTAEIARSVMLDAGLKHSASNIAVGTDTGASWMWSNAGLGSEANMGVGIDLKRAKVIMTMGENGSLNNFFTSLEAANRNPSQDTAIAAINYRNSIGIMANTYQNKDILGMSLAVDTALVDYGYNSLADLNEYNNRGLSPAGALVGAVWKNAALDLMVMPEYQPIYKKDGVVYDWKKDFPGKTYFDDEVKKKAVDSDYVYDNSYCNTLFYDSCIPESAIWNKNINLNSSLKSYLNGNPPKPNAELGYTPIETFQNNLIKAAADGKDIQYWADPKQGYDAARRDGLVLFSVVAGADYHVAGIDITARWSKYEGGVVIQAGGMNGVYSLSNPGVYGDHWNDTKKTLPKPLGDPSGWTKDNHIYYYTMKAYPTYTNYIRK